MGHLDSYNKNQIREKLLLVLIFYENGRGVSKEWNTGAGGAYGNRFTILHYGLQRKLL